MRLYEPVKLSDYCEITSSKRIYAKEYIDSGVPFYRGKEVVASFSGGNVSDPLFISENRFEEIKHRFGAPEKGDLLLTSVGTIGVPYRVTGEFDFYFKDGNLTWFRKLNGVDQNFLYYWLQSPQGKAELSKCTIGAAQPAYTIERLKEISIELPPENIQRDIASVIADYDIALKNNRRRIQLLEESARLLYQEWFVHLRFPGHEQAKITDGVPEGWEKKLLSELCVDIRETIKPDSIKPETPYIGLEHIPRRSITLSDWDSAEKVTSNKFRFQKSDIIFGKIRPYFHKVGFAICDGITSADAIVIRALDEFYYQYLLMYLSSDYFVALASKTCKEGSKMPRADWKYLQSTDVLVPSDFLLEQYSEQINMIIGQLEVLARYNKSLAQARDLLLPKLMSGELTV